MSVCVCLYISVYMSNEYMCKNMDASEGIYV